MEEFDFDKWIFKGLKDNLGFDMFRFVVIKLEFCNGMKSILFLEVICEYEVLRNKINWWLCVFFFILIFNEGVFFLESLEKGSSDDIKNMEFYMKEVFLCFNVFYKVKGEKRN